MVDLFGERVRDIPYYGLLEGEVAGRSVVVSQTGFTGEKGYEIYLRDATLYAEDMWDALLAAGERHQLMVIAPAHHRRIAAGILSWGQGHGPRDLAVPVQPRLPSAAQKEGRLYRQAKAQ